MSAVVPALAAENRLSGFAQAPLTSGVRAGFFSDSAQFSASVAELADHLRVGTMLAVQTAPGFMLTLATIHLMPHLVAAVGWRYAFAPLANGPALGVRAMARLRAHPDPVRLASGRR